MTVAAMRDAIRHAGGVKRGRRPSSKSSGSRSDLVKKMKKLGLSHKSKSVAQMRSVLKHQRSAKKKGYSELSGKSPKRNKWIDYYRKHAPLYKAQHPKAKQSTVMKHIAREYKKRRDAGALSPSPAKSARKSVSKSASRKSASKSKSSSKAKKVKKARGRKPSSKKKGSKHDLRKKYKKLYGNLPPNYMTIADLRKAISKHSNSSGDLSLEEFSEGDIARVLSPKRSASERASPKRSSPAKGSARRLLSKRSASPKGRHREMSDDEVSKEFDEEFNRF